KRHEDPLHQRPLPEGNGVGPGSFGVTAAWSREERVRPVAGLDFAFVGRGVGHYRCNSISSRSRSRDTRRAGGRVSSALYQRKKTTVIVIHRLKPTRTFMIRPAKRMSSSADRPHRRGTVS